MLNSNIKDIILKTEFIDNNNYIKINDDLFKFNNSYGLMFGDMFIPFFSESDLINFIKSDYSCNEQSYWIRLGMLYAIKYNIEEGNFKDVDVDNINNHIIMIKLRGK